MPQKEKSLDIARPNPDPEVVSFGDISPSARPLGCFSRDLNRRQIWFRRICQSLGAPGFKVSRWALRSLGVSGLRLKAKGFHWVLQGCRSDVA